MEPEAPGGVPHLELLQYSAPEPSADATHRRRGPLVVIGGIVLLLAAALTVLALVRGDDDRNPSEALAHAQEIVREAKSVRFTYHAAISAPDLAEEDAEPVDGTAEWSPTAWKIVETTGESSSELMLVDDTLYSRFDFDGTWYAAKHTPVTHEDMRAIVEFMGEFDSFDFDDTDPETVSNTVDVVVAVMAMFNNDTSATGVFIADPGAFLDSIQQLASPIVVAEDGDVLTLGMTVVADADLVDGFGRPIPDVAVELGLGEDDVPSAMRLRTASGDAEVAFDVSFSDWGQPVELTAPDDSDVELDETAVPTEVPVVDGITPLRIGGAAGDWKIRSAGTGLWTDDSESSADDCGARTLTLVWANGDGQFAILNGTVMMMLMPRACADEFDLSELPEPVPGALVVRPGIGGYDGDEIGIEGDDGGIGSEEWVAVTEDTVATIIYLSYSGADDGATSIGDALEITDWETIQGDLATR